LATTFDPQDDFGDLVGTWEINARSEHGTQAKGRCEITSTNERLSLSGTYEEESKPTIVWQSDFAFVDGNRLFYVYRLDAGPDNYIGYVRLFVKRSASHTDVKVANMLGDWVAIGAQRKRGNIAFERA
jgi:hypothetical protein